MLKNTQRQIQRAYKHSEKYLYKHLDKYLTHLLFLYPSLSIKYWLVSETGHKEILIFGQTCYAVRA